MGTPKKKSVGEIKEGLIENIIESLQPLGMEMGSDLKEQLELCLNYAGLKDLRRLDKQSDNWIFDWDEAADCLVNKMPLTHDDILTSVSHETRPDHVTHNIEKLLIPISANMLQAWGLGNLAKVKKCIHAISTITSGARRLIEKQLYHNLK